MTGEPAPSQAEIFLAQAQNALLDRSRDVRQAWTDGLPGTHRLHQDDRVFAISTQGARRHASEEQILDMAARLLEGNWGDVQFQEDRDRNGQNRRRERGTIFGIYKAPDGTALWATQSHRFVPPTIMLPEEH